MTARLALIALTGWALAAPAAAEDYKLEDVLVSGLHQGRAVATGRTDSRGAFRLEFPAGPSAADQICFSGPSVRAAMAPVPYGDDNETLLRRGGAQPSGPGGEPQRAETLVELLVVIAVNDRPQGGEQRLVIPGARIRAGQARSADLDLCYRPFVNVGDAPPPGIVPATTRQGATGPRTLPSGPDGAARATASEPVYVRNADGTYSIVELRPGQPSAGAGGPIRQEGGTVTGRVTSSAGVPVSGLGSAGGVPTTVDHDGDGRQVRRSDPSIPPPGARTGPAPRPTIVTGTVSLVESRR